MPIWEGRHKASRTWVIKAALMMGIPFVVKSPLSFQMAEWDNKVKGIFTVIVNMNSFVFSQRVLARAVSSAFWEVALKGRGCASMTVEIETIAYPAFHCPL
jgi:hypothetical protein